MDAAGCATRATVTLGADSAAGTGGAQEARKPPWFKYGVSMERNIASQMDMLSSLPSIEHGNACTLLA